MNTLDFLKLVWPAQGTYLTLIPISGTNKDTGLTWHNFRHFAHPTIEAAAAHAQALAANSLSRNNVFFALGTVKEDLTGLSKDERDVAQKKVRGKHKSGHDNTDQIKCFWFDLDVDPAKEPLTYPTRQAAWDALPQFCNAMGLPRPYITSSGGGYHVYWPLTDSLDPETWQKYANILKQLAQSWGLRADRSRTADRASVLRVLGTFNWKTDTARPVTLELEGQVVDTNAFTSKLQMLADSFSLPEIQPRGAAPQGMVLAGVAPTLVQGADINAGAVAGAGYDQPDARLVVAKCQQLRWQATNQGLVPEPLWYTMIGVLRHAQDGVKAIHMMSCQSPTYNAANTDLKIQQHIDGNYGPSLCATFEMQRPGGCDGCPLRDKVKSPIGSSRVMTAVAPPTIHMQAANGAQVSFVLPPPPQPFKRAINPLTGMPRIVMEQGDSQGNVEEIVIYEYDLHPSGLIFDERDQRYCVAIRRWLPRDGWADFEVPTGKLYDKKQLAMTFGDIGVMPDLGHVENLVQYMIGYIRDLQKAASSSILYAQLGWRPDGQQFILPDRVVSATGVETITPSKNVTRALSWVEPRGTLDEWKKIMAVYERPGMEAHQFGFGVGFASPLFIHTNFKGMIVSMVGKRGAGKSSAAMSANSIWGHPTMGWADLEHDTLRAFYQKLGVLNNLPATYDEHTNLEGDVVSDLCYMVSKGQGRQRLKQNGESQENHGNFQLMMLMTGNTSLNSRLAMAKADASAESARVFEYVVPENTLTKSEADDNWGPGGAISSNYGLAGEIYARQLTVSQDWAKDRVRYWVKEVDRLANVSSGERFWSAGVACVLTGFELANHCGLTNVDIQRLLTFSVNTIRSMRGIVTDNTRSPVNIVSDYLNTNLRSTLILGSEASGLTAAQMLHTPSDKLRVRLERHTHKLYIDRADFRRFCGNQQIDSRSVLSELQLTGALKSVDAKVTLGKGTPWSGTQTICLVFDMKNPALIGQGELVVVPGTSPVVGQTATP